MYRRVRLRFSQAPEPQDLDTSHPPESLISGRRIYEVDPLVRPSCGSGMKVIAFITEHEVIDAILRHLERKEVREARGPPN